MFYAAEYSSPLGTISLVCNETHLLELTLETQQSRLKEKAEWIDEKEISEAQKKKVKASLADENTSEVRANFTNKNAEGALAQASYKKDAAKRHALQLLGAVSCWLDSYFAGKNPDPNQLPLAPQGSAFRQMVWKELLKIPSGQTTTYGAIAGTIAKKLHKEKMSARAVGGAVGHNPIAIIIPCHRVVGSDGSLTGYAGGLDMKRKLLQHEQEFCIFPFKKAVQI